MKRNSADVLGLGPQVGMSQILGAPKSTDMIEVGWTIVGFEVFDHFGTNLFSGSGAFPFCVLHSSRLRIDFQAGRNKVLSCQDWWFSINK